MKTFLLALTALLVGCASNSTHQEDRPDGTRVTKGRALSFLAGKSSMRGVKVTHTDKTQGVSIEQTEQESDASKLAEVLGALLLRGMATYMTGGAAAMTPAATTPTAPVVVPRGYKLVPVDDPSTPQLEIAIPDGKAQGPAVGH